MAPIKEFNAFSPLTPILSVVIVNYNNLHFLQECLDSVYFSSLENFEVVVVDNSSTRVDISGVTSKFPGVKIFSLTRNQGFAYGANYGILHSRGEYILLLNNDVRIVGDSWKTVVDCFAQDEKAAAIQPTIMIDGTPLINNRGLEVNILGFAWNKQYRRPADESDKVEALAAFSGAAVILRRTALEEVDYFDDNYFMYHEDVDVSCRLRLAGWKIVLRPEFEVFHHYSYKRDAWRYYFLERNRLFTILKTFPLGLLLLTAPAAIFMEIGMVYFSLTNKWFLRKMRIYFDIVVALPRILQSRKRQKIAITTKDFVSLLKGPIVFEEIQTPPVNWILNPILRLSYLVVRSII